MNRSLLLPTLIALTAHSLPALAQSQAVPTTVSIAGENLAGCTVLLDGTPVAHHTDASCRSTTTQFVAWDDHPWTDIRVVCPQDGDERRMSLILKRDDHDGNVTLRRRAELLNIEVAGGTTRVLMSRALDRLYYVNATPKEVSFVQRWSYDKLGPQPEPPGCPVAMQHASDPAQWPTSPMCPVLWDASSAVNKTTPVLDPFKCPCTSIAQTTPLPVPPTCEDKAAPDLMPTSEGCTQNAECTTREVSVPAYAARLLTH